MIDQNQLFQATFMITNIAIRNEIAFIRSIAAALADSEEDRISELEYLSEMNLAELPEDTFQTEDLEELKSDLVESIDMLLYSSKILMSQESIDRKAEMKRLEAIKSLVLSA